MFCRTTETIKSILKQYHDRIGKLEDVKFDLEYQVKRKDMEVRVTPIARYYSTLLHDTNSSFESYTICMNFRLTRWRVLALGGAGNGMWMRLQEDNRPLHKQKHSLFTLPLYHFLRYSVAENSKLQPQYTVKTSYINYHHTYC